MDTNHVNSLRLNWESAGGFQVTFKQIDWVSDHKIESLSFDVGPLSIDNRSCVVYRILRNQPSQMCVVTTWFHIYIHSMSIALLGKREFIIECV